MTACNADDDGPEIGCPTCGDSGEVPVGEWGMPMPCPDCEASDLRIAFSVRQRIKALQR